jgi:hypothetical protein
MIRLTRPLPLFAMLVLSLPGPAAGQFGADCIILQSGSMNVFNGRTPQELVFIGGGARFRCPDNVTIASDSVARYTGQALIEFIGNVRYSDAENLLTANYVRYVETDRSAIAQGNVVLTDRATGSVIRAPVMNYYQPGPNREEALIRIPSGRPHAVLVSLSETDPSRRDTTIVDADRMDITGRSRFDAWGTVELTRPDVVGLSEEASWDRETGNLRLAIEARLTAEDYVLMGDTVRGRTNDADEIDELTAVHSARLEGTEVTVEAPLIRLFFSESEVQRLVAVGEPPAEDEIEREPRLDPATRATATSTDFRLTADSIDAIAPLQVLDRVVAVGHAYGERLGDELADANVPAIAARDWLRGDTVIAVFTAREEIEPDSASAVNRTQVDHVIAVGVGDRATSTYRVRNEDDPAAEPGINYMLARRIVIQLREGGVEAVQAEGEVQGMYLQPTVPAGGANATGGGGARR